VSRIEGAERQDFDECEAGRLTAFWTTIACDQKPGLRRAFPFLKGDVGAATRKVFLVARAVNCECAEAPGFRD
jgi:hypothetical protein